MAERRAVTQVKARTVLALVWYIYGWFLPKGEPTMDKDSIKDKYLTIYNNYD